MSGETSPAGSYVPNDTFGIDHPLVTVRDHSGAIDAYRKLGFRPSAVSFHPWGTATSLLMFPGNFVELISVVDPAKFGTNAIGEFCFGRFLGAFLERTEGISLVALHSRDCDADYTRLVKRGLSVRGRVDFRRPMVLPDGTRDVAVVSLGLLVDPALPEASNFLCHQHKPELIWVPDWCLHPNGALGIDAVIYRSDDDRLERRFDSIYGRASAGPEGECIYATAKGEFRLLSSARARERFPGTTLPEPIDGRPRAIAIAIAVRSVGLVAEILSNTRLPSIRGNNRIVVGAEHCGGTIIEFVERRGR